MERVGRKPIEADLLRGYADQWACLLYGLRDGYPGFIQITPQGKRRKSTTSTRGARDNHNFSDVIPLTARVIRVTSQLEPTRYGSEERKKFLNALRKMKQSLQRGGFTYVEPVPPAREIWDRLKNAKRPQAVGEAFQMLRKWAVSIRGPSIHMCPPNTHPIFIANARSKAWARAAVRGAVASGQIPSWPLLPFAISEDWAGEIAKAKNLWTYPRADRPTSDDKRIEFFAKCFAALMLGKSPATATARWLAGWHWPKDWYSRETPYTG
jgi:hypothetical protein